MSLARGIHCYPILFLLDQRLYIVKNMCIYTSDCAGIVYELALLPWADNFTNFMCRLSWNLGAPSSWNTQGLSRPVKGLLYPNNTASETFLRKLGAVRSVDLAVTGRTRDIWQNVLKSSFRKGSSSSPSYFHIFLLCAFLEENFIRNITIILYINYNVHY